MVSFRGYVSDKKRQNADMEVIIMSKIRQPDSNGITIKTEQDILREERENHPDCEICNYTRFKHKPGQYTCCEFFDGSDWHCYNQASAKFGKICRRKCPLFVKKIKSEVQV
jgi:hypothetical protein